MKVRSGLIQMALKGETSKSPEEITKKMIEAHIPYIEEAGEKDVQVLCMQEVFTQPYFCPRILSGIQPLKKYLRDQQRNSCRNTPKNITW